MREAHERDTCCGSHSRGTVYSINAVLVKTTSKGYGIKVTVYFENMKLAPYKKPKRSYFEVNTVLVGSDKSIRISKGHNRTTT